MYEKGIKYDITYIDDKGHQKTDTFIPDKDISIAGIITELKSNKEDFFKLISVNESKKVEEQFVELLDEDKKSDYTDLEKQIEKEAYNYLLEECGVDIKDNIDTAIIEEYLAEFQSNIFVDYQDNNGVELLFDYEFAPNSEYGIKISVWEL